MNPIQKADRQIETHLLELALDHLPGAAHDRDAFRELRIQNAKLRRMLSQPSNKSGLTRAAKILSGASLKKMKKKEGRLNQRIGNQDRKVRLMTSKFFKGYFRQSNPDFSNAAFRKWEEDYEKGTRLLMERLKTEATRLMKP